MERNDFRVAGTDDRIGGRSSGTLTPRRDLAGARVFVYGFPSLYGGAGTELHHQILLWQSLGVEVHLIPDDNDYLNNPLLAELIERQTVVHEVDDFVAIDPGSPVFGYCSSAFLENIDAIRAQSTNTVFVNCMTWLFDLEKRRMAEGKIRVFLYQNADVLNANSPTLRALNPGAATAFLLFTPYFDQIRFPFHELRDDEYFGCGRISRQDADKYASNTLLIYEYFVAPKPKRGLFVGFDDRSLAKIGEPHDWISTALDQTECSQQDFYRHCEIVLQPSYTIENWPRIGLEAMASGSVLIVDNRGGWRRQVVHGVTGWLCDHERDFIYYASKMAYEPDVRAAIAIQARERLDLLAGPEVSTESWLRVLNQIL